MKITVIASVECKHQRGSFWAEQQIRGDARNLEREFGVPVLVRVERGKWWQPRTAYGSVEMTLTEKQASFVERYEKAIKRDLSDDVWARWSVDGIVREA
jgi:hypothetical protein